MSATVIIPTTGSPDLKQAIDSVLRQDYTTTCYVVVDGPRFKEKSEEILQEYKNIDNVHICYLPTNSGHAGLYYGHRVISSFIQLVDTEYVLFLDQDCWMDSNHVSSMVDTITENSLDWCHSLRKIYDKEANYLLDDNCESLGKIHPVVDYNLVDTNCYCIKRNVAIQVAPAIHGGWGQDRVFYSVLSKYFPNYDCSGKHTLCYRLGGNDGSVKKEFFERGNEIVESKYKGEYPWVKKI